MTGSAPMTLDWSSSITALLLMGSILWLGMVIFCLLEDAIRPSNPRLSLGDTGHPQLQAESRAIQKRRRRKQGIE